MEARIVEKLLAVYSPNGSLVNTSVGGELVVVNKEDYPLKKVNISLANFSLSGLPEHILVDTLEPGENVVATYNVSGEPGIALGEEWKALTYEEYLDDLVEEGVLAPEAAEFYKGRAGVIHGRDNLLEFNLTVVNRFDREIRNVTVSNLLPDVLVNVSSITPGGVAYDPLGDTLVIDILPAGENVTVTLRASLKEEVVGDPAVDYIDLSKETTARYSMVVEETAEWVPVARALEEVGQALVEEAGVLANLSAEFNLTSGLALNQSFDFATALEEGAIEDALAASQEFMENAQSTSMDFAEQAGRIQRTIDHWDNLSRTVKEATTIPPGSLDEVLYYVQVNGLPGETLEMMQGYGLTQDEVVSMLQQLNTGDGVELPDLAEDLKEYRNTSLELADYFFEAAFTSLEDQVGANIYELNQSSRAATQEEYMALSGIKAQLLSAAEARDWSAIHDLAGEEAEYARSLALLTNNFTFVDFYGVAYKARLIAELALGGDQAWAEELLLSLMPLLGDDPGVVYFEGYDGARYYGWYETLADGSVTIRIVAPCCGFSKSVTVEGKKYDLLLNFEGVPNYCGGARFSYGRRTVWIGEEDVGIYSDARWMDSGCRWNRETTNIDDRVRIDQTDLDYEVTFTVLFKSNIKPPPNGSLAGLVHDARGIPRPNVTLNIIDPSTFRVVAEAHTDAYGRYSVSLPEGGYVVKTGTVGYVNAPRAITVGKYETRLADVYAAKQPLAAASKPLGPTLKPTTSQLQTEEGKFFIVTNQNKC